MDVERINWSCLLLLFRDEQAQAQDDEQLSSARVRNVVVVGGVVAFALRLLLDKLEAFITDAVLFSVL